MLYGCVVTSLERQITIFVVHRLNPVIFHGNLGLLEGTDTSFCLEYIRNYSTQLCWNYNNPLCRYSGSPDYTDPFLFFSDEIETINLTLGRGLDSQGGRLYYTVIWGGQFHKPL